jgi:hypothetical protein
MVTLLLMGAGAIIYFVVAIMLLVGLAAASLFSGGPGWLQAALSIAFTVIVGLVVLLVILLLYSRVVYVPQVMVVEGKGVFNAISRSFSLAGRETWRIAALLLFWIYVAWSVWLMLYIPLAAVGAWFGVDPNPFNQDMPFWFTISYQTIAQVSEILIAPIALLGFTLLYLDSRVRKEGFDVELLANRLMPATQHMIQQQMMPQPVFFASPAPPQSNSSPFPTILGLSDYTPIRQTTIEPVPPAAPEEVLLQTEAAGGVEPSVIIAAPAEFQPIPVETAPVILPETLPSQSEPAISATDTFLRTCRWCGTEASGDDRFCRVCGSVF